MKRPYLILPVGPPGAGKSTLVNKLVANGLDVDAIVCPDEYRRVMTGSRSDQTANSNVFLVANTIAEIRLSRGLHVYYDATNLTTLEHHREVANHYGATIVCVRFEVASDELRSRNKNRAFPVPEHVLESMIRRFDDLRPAQYPGAIFTCSQAEDWANMVGVFSPLTKSIPSS